MKARWMQIQNVIMVGWGGWQAAGRVGLGQGKCICLPLFLPLHALGRAASQTAFTTPKAPTFLLERIYRAERKIKITPFEV